jgi:flagellar hook-associated protein 1 FlgK
MGSLSVSLLNSAQAEVVYSKALNIVQNNIANVNTPGYATQSASFTNQPFNPAVGLPGGVTLGELQNSRSIYAEKAVQTQQSYLSQNQQVSTDLNNLNPAFDLSSSSSIPTTMTALFSSFSNLAVNPNDPLTRQQVITAAGTAAQSINRSANQINDAVQQTDAQAQQTVASINSDIQTLQNVNIQRANSPDSQHDAGLDGQVYATLQDLSQYANIQSIQQPDGSVNVYLAGQTPLLVGSHAYAISAAPTNTATAILDSKGNDITTQVTSGHLAGLVQERNTLLPSYAANLNQLAQSFADTVNNQLNQGVDSTGATPGTSLFTYNATTGAAASLAVTSIQPSEIAAATASAPGGNANALALAQLGSAKAVNGVTFAQFFGSAAASFGNDLSQAQSNTTTGQNLLAQATTNRQTVQGVDLNQQAAILIQFQQAYQAAGDMFRVLNQLTQDTLNLIQ